MKQQGNLLRFVATGSAALALCSLAFGYVASYFDGQFQPLNAIGLSSSGVLLSFWSFVFGIPAIALYGVPIYSALARKGKANWPFILAAAALPCLLLGFWSWHAGMILAGFAFPIAAAIRLRHGAGPNNSFKPTPLRGVGKGS